MTRLGRARPEIRHQERQDAGSHAGRGAAAAEFDQRQRQFRPARPRPARGHGLQFRARLGRVVEMNIEDYWQYGAPARKRRRIQFPSMKLSGLEFNPCGPQRLMARYGHGKPFEGTTVEHGYRGGSGGDGVCRGLGFV